MPEIKQDTAVVRLTMREWDEINAALQYAAGDGLEGLVRAQADGRVRCRLAGQEGGGKQAVHGISGMTTCNPEMG